MEAVGDGAGVASACEAFRQMIYRQRLDDPFALPQTTAVDPVQWRTRRVNRSLLRNRLPLQWIA